MSESLWAGLTSLAFLAACLAATGQVRTSRNSGASNHSTIGPDGTAYITRVVPVPRTISQEAQKMLSRRVPDTVGPSRSVQEDRIATDHWQASAGELSRKMYPAVVSTTSIAGVPVKIINPLVTSPAMRDRVLLNLHGGGFHVDSGSLTETIPIAHLTGIQVISVLYRLAPENPYPAAAEDAVSVYRELLKTHTPKQIAIYGTSAGAILTAEVTVRIRDQGLPLPAATGFFSGTGDLSQSGDSVNMYGLNGLSGHLDLPPENDLGLVDYIGHADPKDPELSPYYADLRGLPPTLFLTSGRDRRLSGTTILHRAYLRADVHAQLVVFEGLPHAFWNTPQLPESREANQIMARFFLKELR